MDIQNFEYNGIQARYLGFNGITDELMQNIKPGMEKYTAHRNLVFDGERVLYSLPYTKGKDQDDRFYLNEYSATRFFNINISHPDPAKVPFDSAALEERMKKVRWRDVQPTADEDGVVTYGPEVDNILKDLSKLGDWNIGRKYRDKLEAKYLLGTPMQLHMAHPGEAWDRYTRTQTFKVHTKRKGQDEVSETINAEQAYHMLCGRPVSRFTVSDFREPGDTWFLLRFDPKLKSLDGNFKMQPFVPKYGYDLDKVFDKKFKDGTPMYPFRELEDRVSRDSVAAMMKRGELAPVTYDYEGKPVRYFVSPNLDKYTLKIYRQDRTEVLSTNLREDAKLAVQKAEKLQEEYNERRQAGGQPLASGANNEGPAPTNPEDGVENKQKPGDPQETLPELEHQLKNDFSEEQFVEELGNGIPNPMVSGSDADRPAEKNLEGADGPEAIQHSTEPKQLNTNKIAAKSVAKKTVKQTQANGVKNKRSAGRGR